jgi:hypothetical protein
MPEHYPTQVLYRRFSKRAKEMLGLALLVLQILKLLLDILK